MVCFDHMSRGQAWKAVLITVPSGRLPVTESVVLPPDQGEGIMIDAFHRATMSKVQGDKSLARITPGRSGFDIRTFECRACDHIYQRVVALVIR